MKLYVYLKFKTLNYKIIIVQQHDIVQINTFQIHLNGI